MSGKARVGSDGGAGRLWYSLVGFRWGYGSVQEGSVESSNSVGFGVIASL